MLTKAVLLRFVEFKCLKSPRSENKVQAVYQRKYSNTIRLNQVHSVCDLQIKLYSLYTQLSWGSIPGGVTGNFFIPSVRAMDLGLTQPLTQMSARNISCG